MAKRFVSKKNDFSLVKSILLPLAGFVAIVALFNSGLSGLSQKTAYEQLESTRQAVRNATVQCYSLEGQYPPSIQYLKEHYGLQVDTEKYIIDYQQNEMGNMMPAITVLPRYFTAADLPQQIDPLDEVDALPQELVDMGVVE